MTSPLPSATLRLEDLLVKWQEMESDWHIQSATSSSPSPRSGDDSAARQGILERTQHLQHLMQEYSLYSARWKWIPPPFHTHWTAGQRASYLDVHARQTHAVAAAAPLVRTAVIENRCVVYDTDPSYPRFCVVVWPCTAALSVPKLIQALQSLRKGEERVAAQHFDLVWALPRDAQRLTFAVTAQCACPLLPSNENHGIPVILSKSVVPLRYFWMDTGHWQAKLGVTVADFVRIVQPVVAPIEREHPDEVLTDPNVPAKTLDVIPEDLRRPDVDVEALRLTALEQTLPLIANNNTAFRPPRRSVPLHVLHKTTVASQQRRLQEQQRQQQREREERARREMNTLSRRKPPVPRLSPTSRLLQHTQSYAAHLRKDNDNEASLSLPPPRHRKPALPPEARGVANRALSSSRQSRGYERSTAAQRGRSVPPTSSLGSRGDSDSSSTSSRPRSTKRRTRGSSAPLPTSRSNSRPLAPIPDMEPEEADEIIGSVENDEDFLLADDMMLDDLLSDEGEIVFDKNDNERGETKNTNKEGEAAETASQNDSSTPAPSPKKEMQTAIVSELYKKLTAIPVPSEDEMQALFEQVDREGRGMLRLRNIETAIVQRKFDLPPTVVLRAFQTADTDKDGAIGRDEFFQFMRCITYFENLMQLFMEMDVDSDRRLDQEEFLKAADVLEVADPEAVFGEMNGERSGYVVFDQFCLWMSEKRALEDVGAWSTGGSTKRNLELTSLVTTGAEMEQENHTLEQKLLEEERLGAEAAAAMEKAAAEAEEKLSAEKAAAEAEAHRLEAERIAAEEARRLAEEPIAAGKAAAEAEARRLETERIAAEEARRLEERVAAEKAAEARRLEAERRATEKAAAAAEEARRLEEERLAAEKVAAEAEARRLEEERIAAEKAAMEKAAAEEASRVEEERIAAEKTAAEAEARRLDEERIAVEKAAAVEAKRLEEEQIAKEKEEEAAKRLEEKQIAAEQEEAKRSEEERLAKVEEERTEREEAARLQKLERERLAMLEKETEEKARQANSEQARKEAEEQVRNEAEEKAILETEEKASGLAEKMPRAETDLRAATVAEELVTQEPVAEMEEHQKSEEKVQKMMGIAADVGIDSAEALDSSQIVEFSESERGLPCPSPETYGKPTAEATSPDGEVFETLVEDDLLVRNEIATPRKDGEPRSVENGDVENGGKDITPDTMVQTENPDSPSKVTLDETKFPPETETPFKEGKPINTTLDTEASFFSADGLSPIKGEESYSAVQSQAVAVATATTEEFVVSTGKSDLAISNASKNTPQKGSNADSDREKLKAIMERRRKMAEEEEAVKDSNVPKAKVHQSTLDAEVQAKLDRRRTLSDDGLSEIAETRERRASTRGAALDNEVQSKLERRRCLSDDGMSSVLATDEVERRATTRQKELRSFQMSNDLQAIMARRRQAADAESKNP